MLKVLVVEDSVLLADMIEDFLVSGGYEVCGIARTIEEAVALADLHKPDLGVFDYRLSNNELSSQIRPQLHDKISMAILYASGDALDTLLSDADGVAYIQKPYGGNDLLRALAAVVAIKTGVPAQPLYQRGFHLLKPAPVILRQDAA